MTNRGFYSAVQDRTDPDTLVIRARVRGDLDALRPMLGRKMKVITDEGTDYAFRVRVTRAEWAAVVAAFALDIGYGNFKTEVKRRQGARRAEAYMKVWSALYALQPARKWPKREPWDFYSEHDRPAAVDLFSDNIEPRD